jgi:hypothetical protein
MGIGGGVSSNYVSAEALTALGAEAVAMFMTQFHIHLPRREVETHLDTAFHTFHAVSMSSLSLGD